MKKYLELFKEGFPSDMSDRTAIENWPYVGHDVNGGVVYTVVPVAVNYLCLEPLEENNQLAVLKMGSGNTQYSFDKETWNEFPVDSSNPLNPVFVTVDRPVYLKGNNPNGYLNFEVGGCKIVGSGKYNVSGDATTLLNEKGNVKDLTPYGERCLMGLFGYLDVSDIFGTNTILPCLNVVDVSELILPSTILTPYCYAHMFAGIEESSSYQGHIINAPKLPATTLAAHCYENMFSYCMDLEVAPELPATKLAPYCYSHMFSDHCGIKEAPELPATTLAEGCYSGMFAAAHSMTTAPKLPATKLAPYCYASMFDSCTSITTAPELPATKLADSCYSLMFWGCRSLTTAPELPATELAEGCYQYMFDYCISLIAAPKILPATTLAKSCYERMFSNCISLVTAPELPATELAERCYQSMFLGCRSLTTAPELPATTLALGCYNAMFDGCEKLNYIKCLATDISASYCVSGWVERVSSTGTFVKHPSMNDWTTGADGIPSGWTVEDA